MPLTFPDEWLKWFCFLPDDVSRGRLFRAIAAYVTDGTEPDDLQGAEIAMFESIRKSILGRNRSNRYYAKRKGKRVNLTLEHVNHTCESHGKKVGQNELKNVNHTCESHVSKTTTPDLSSNQHLNKDSSLNPRIIKNNTPPLFGEICESHAFRLEAQEEQEQGFNDTEKKLKTRISRLFNRRETTQWNEKEMKQLKAISRRAGVLDELSEIEQLYNSGYEYRRRDIITFLNNFGVELDRARNQIQTHKKVDRNKIGF